MRLSSTIIPLILVLLIWQSPQDSIRRHYEAAEALRLAGNSAAAETEYTAILTEGYERLAEIYLVQEKHQSAIAILESALEYRSNSPALLINLAIAYFGVEKYEKAADAARRALIPDSENSGAHQMLGKSYFMLGELGKSVSELETAAKLTPNDVDVVYTLGIAYLRNRQFAEAKQLYASMIKQFGERPQLYVVIGRAYRQSGLLTEAAEEFKKAIALDARFPRAHYYLGITYLLDEGQSKVPDALEEFKLEVAENPDEFLGNYYLGVVYIFQRQWESAITVLEKAATIEPKNPDPYFQLGQAYQELNQHERAIEVLRKAIVFNPNLAHNKGQVTNAHHRLAQSLLKLGQTEAGRKELEIASDLKAQAFKLEQQTQTDSSGMGLSRLPADEANATEPSLRKRLNSATTVQDESKVQELAATAAYYEKVVATAHNNVGLLRAEQKDFRAAAAHFSRAIELNPEQEGLTFNLGLAYYRDQAYEWAIPPLEQELKIHPENNAARVVLGMSSFMAELYARTAELLGSVVETNAGDANLQYALTASFIRQGKIDLAQPLIEQMRTDTSSAPYLHLLLAEAYFSRGEMNKAFAELNDLSIKNSDAQMVHYYAGMIYVKLNKPDDANGEFERELTLNPNNTPAKYQLASNLLTRKNPDRGIALMREIIQARPEHDAARYALGQALLKRRDFPGAIENLEAAARRKPENAEVHYQLGQAYLAAGRQAEGKNEIAISNKLKSKVSEKRPQ